MRYAIETQDGVFVKNGDTPFPEGSAFPAPLEYIPSRYYKIVNGQVVEKSEIEKRIIDLPSKYRKYENNQCIELSQEEKDTIDKIEADLLLQKEIEKQEELARQEIEMQTNKSPSLKTAENNFLLMCDSLTLTTSHTKIGFDELNTIIEAIQDPLVKMTIAVKLLAIDAECKREGGLLWWDTCIWHDDIVQ